MLKISSLHFVPSRFILAIIRHIVPSECFDRNGVLSNSHSLLWFHSSNVPLRCGGLSWYKSLIKKCCLRLGLGSRQEAVMRACSSSTTSLLRRTAWQPTLSASPTRKQTRRVVVLLAPKMGDRSNTGTGNGARTTGFGPALLGLIFSMYCQYLQHYWLRGVLT